MDSDLVWTEAPGRMGVIIEHGEDSGKRPALLGAFQLLGQPSPRVILSTRHRSVHTSGCKRKGAKNLVFTSVARCFTAATPGGLAYEDRRSGGSARMGAGGYVRSHPSTFLERETHPRSSGATRIPPLSR